ncbi:hypothetical protein ACXR2U_19245 [Jatrophihabitans sp. YIM 134969]
MSQRGIHAHVARLTAVGVRGGADGRFVDLRQVTWLDPLHLVCVAASAAAAARDGVPFELLGPSGEQARYAARMHLGEVLDSFGARHTLARGREHDRSDVLVETTVVRDASGVRALAELVFDKVEKTDRHLAAGLFTSLAEISANVNEHAQSVGFAAAQTVDAAGVIRFAVADSGVGMLHTLRSRGARDSRTAIGMALSGTSRVDEATHGRGLPSVVRDVAALDGQLLVASHDAVTTVDRSGRTHLAAEVPFRGTVLEGALPLADRRTRRAGDRDTLAADD